MKSIRYTLLLAAAALWAASCQKLDLATADPDVAVVEAYLAPNAPIRLHITRQLVYASSDTAITPIEGLTISIKSTDTSVVCTPDSAGYYSTAITPREGETYTMTFLYNNKTVSATTTIPAKPVNYTASASTITVGMGGDPGSGTPPTPPTPVTLAWNNPDLSYYMVVTECLEADPEPIFDTTEVVPMRIFRNTPDRIETQNLNPGAFYYLGNHRVILFHLNAEYAQLYDDNGTSSLNLAKPPTNVVNGLGVFTGINADTLLIQVNED